ncbi:hypothetical protein PMAA_058880 [Talaromyces marneffei ATCC 18224]|uniref:Uncharacterized protein n=1 Tax=Talaromyces marneffei (strain ATCC 18224 / CBS 334.59 / QM 7333) TaxID=441960 RepID=B6QLY1_TALMQ|nr:hypothetical protein PMAA_058880 [Talaromyces marneffei ATCC 18224]
MALSVLPAVCIAGSTVVAGHLPSVSEFLAAGTGAAPIANDLPGVQAQIQWNAAPNARLIAIEDEPGDTIDEPIELDLEDGSQDNPYELD